MREDSQTKFVVVALIAIFTVLAISNAENIRVAITTWATKPELDVSIDSEVKGKIMLNYQTNLDFGARQEIYVEFMNIGTDTYDAAIEEQIYFLNGTKLTSMVSYYDNSVELDPGERKDFRTVFVPPERGIYYIRVRVPYDSRVAQTWGAFVVGQATTTTPTSIVVYIQPQVAVPIAGPTVTTLGPAGANIYAPERVPIVQGSSRIFNATVSNVGDRVLNNLKFYISAPNVLGIDINPKVVSSLRLNSSVMFLVTVNVGENVTEGSYPVELQLATDELSKTQSVTIDVLLSNTSMIEYLKGMILNYEYLLDKIGSEIYMVSLEGYDVSLANESLMKARTSLDTAKGYFDAGDFENTKLVLKDVETYIEDAVFYLANAILYIYRPPAYFPFLFIILEALLAIIIFGVFYWNRRRKRKPEALRAAAEAEGEAE